MLSLLQDYPKGSSAGIVFTHPWADYSIKLKFGSSGLWIYGPKILKIWNFTNITAPEGQVPCMILTKFTRFMHVLSLHNSAKKIMMAVTAIITTTTIIQPLATITIVQ